MREAYCGTIAYQIEHLSSHQQRIWLRDMIETGCAPQAARAGGEARAPQPPDPGLRASSASSRRPTSARRCSRSRGSTRWCRCSTRSSRWPHTRGRARRGDRHGAPRPAQRPGAQHRPPGRGDPGRVRGREGDRGGQVAGGDPHGRHRRRQVPLRARRRRTRPATARRSASGSIPNPSHLEYVDPVVTGAARAAQTSTPARHLEHDPMAAVPVLLHGDAAFPGQGVVAETLNLQSLTGYATGGTVHIIQNNQIGFTTDPEEGRSTPYAADMAKGFNVPIVHVNADDLEACVAAVRLAMAYRERWGRDVVIDLIGYRRFGHNETDEPAYTQPLMAAKIKEHPPVSQIYAEALVKEGDRHARRGRGANPRAPAAAAQDDPRRAPPARSSPASTRTRPPPARASSTAPAARGRDGGPGEALRKLNEELLRVPDSFTIHRKLRKPLLEAPRRDGRRGDRVRARRGAGVRLAADRGRARPASPARTPSAAPSPPPPRPPRREDGPALRADPEPGGANAPRSSSTTARSRSRLPRLRVRLLGRLAGQPDPLGGAVRRLRQLGPGDHRQLHRLRPRRSGGRPHG